MVTEIGTERQCNGCGEWWPLDKEFYHRNYRGIGGFLGTCRACFAERRGRSGRKKAKWSEERPLMRAMLAAGKSVDEVARAIGCSTRTVYREQRGTR